jgi:hypothetical protein
MREAKIDRKTRKWVVGYAGDPNHDSYGTRLDIRPMLDAISRVDYPDFPVLKRWRG